MRITIFGMGRVGSTLASFIVASSLPVSNLHIYDTNKQVSLGNYYDLINMRDLLRKKMKITIGYDKLSDAYIITAGIPRKSGERSFDYPANFQIVQSCLSKCSLKSKVFLLTNPTEKLASSFSKIGYDNIIPIGDLLDKVRIKLRDQPEEIANTIIDTKGYSNFGCIAEVLLRLRQMS